MAAGDYKSCDVCGDKAFYDAQLSYTDGTDKYAKNNAPYRVAGEEQNDNVEMLQKYGLRLGYVGDWAVICDECSKTHQTQIVPRKPSQS